MLASFVSTEFHVRSSITAMNHLPDVWGIFRMTNNDHRFIRTSLMQLGVLNIRDQDPELSGHHHNAKGKSEIKVSRLFTSFWPFPTVIQSWSTNTPRFMLWLVGWDSPFSESLRPGRILIHEVSQHKCLTQANYRLRISFKSVLESFGLVNVVAPADFACAGHKLADLDI